jgi:hypothetical protein
MTPRCFGEEDGTASRFRGGGRSSSRRGCAVPSTPSGAAMTGPEAGGQGDKGNLTPWGACHEAVGDRDDGGPCAPGAGAQRAGVVPSSGAAAPGAGASGPHERRPTAPGLTSIGPPSTPRSGRRLGKRARPWSPFSGARGRTCSASGSSARGVLSRASASRGESCHSRRTATAAPASRRRGGSLARGREAWASCMALAHGPTRRRTAR